MTEPSSTGFIRRGPRAFLRRAIGPLLIGLGATLVLAWPVPLFLLHRGLINHDRHWRAGYIRLPNADWCEASVSSMPLSDWYKIEPSRQVDRPRQLLDQPFYVAMPAPGEHPVRVDTAATGWPLRAFSSESWSFVAEGGGTREELRHNIVLAVTNRGRIMLPLRPLWSGLLGDTALFGGAWWMMVTALSAARQLLRRRRGLCARCGYDLRATPAETPCPECGGGVVARSEIA